ncbi:MAG: hypothetical protein V9G12_16620 [Microthrixaceae bacterium]
MAANELVNVAMPKGMAMAIAAAAMAAADLARFRAMSRQATRTGSGALAASRPRRCAAAGVRRSAPTSMAMTLAMIGSASSLSAAMSAPGQMEFVTPEEIAESAVFEIRGREHGA